MAALTVWHDDLIANAPSCSLGMRNSTVRRIASEFCRDTLLWVDDLYNNGDGTPVVDFPVVADANNYDLTDDTDANTRGAGDRLTTLQAKIHSIKSVKYKLPTATGTESDDDQFSFLTPMTKAVWDRRDSGEWPYREGSAPTGYYMDVDRVLYLYPIPTTASPGGLKITAYLEPSLAATAVPDFIQENHYEVVLDGALWLLLRMQDQPWSDMDMALFYKERYNAQMSEDKQAKWRGRVNRNMRVAYRRFV